MTPIAARLEEMRSSRSRTIRSLVDLADDQLERPVLWRGRAADVRYLLLRLSEDDDDRWVRLGLVLEALGWRQPEPARILASAFSGRVASLLVGFPDTLLDRRPSPGEWSVGQTLEHLRAVEERYLLQTVYAVERLHSTDWPIRIPDDRLPPVAPEPIASPTVESALARLTKVRDEVRTRFHQLAGAELAAPTVWSGWTVDVRFRLHRFGSHERQHAVQIAKTLSAIGWRPSEAQLILGLAEEARAMLEGALLGCPDALAAREPDGDLPTVETILDQALADEGSIQSVASDL